MNKQTVNPNWANYPRFSLTLFALCAALFFPTIMGAQCPGNLLTNSGYENGLSGWNTVGIVGTTTTVHSGTKAATLGGSSYSSLGFVLPATPGTSYSATVWAKVTGNPYPSSVELRFLDANFITLPGPASELVSSSTYTQFNMTNFAPANTKYVYVLAIKDGSTGSLQVDDWCLTSSTSPCNITGNITNITCDDNGTPNPADDRYGFTINASNTAVGNQYQASSGATFFEIGTYGTPLVINDLLISSGLIVVTLKHSAPNPGTCTTTLNVTPPAPCSSSPVTCLGDTLTTQAEVDAWPGCAIVEGNLRIAGSDITDLSPLSTLQKVRGALLIDDNQLLTNLSGLENVDSVEALIVAANPQLVSVTALELAQDDIASVVFYDNDNLTSINGFNSLTNLDNIEILNNNGLTSISGFSNLQTVMGKIHVHFNTNLSSLSGFQNLVSVDENLHLMENHALEHITGFGKLTTVDGIFIINQNDALKNLDGFSSLSDLHDIVVVGNLALEQIDALASVSSIPGFLNVYLNPSLTDCCGLYPLLNSGGVGDYIEIRDNPMPCSNEQDILDNCTPSGGVDLELSLVQPNATPAQWSNYTVIATVNNTGGEPATGVKVSFKKPTGVVYVGGNEFTASQGSFNPNSDEVWTVGNVPAGGSATLTVNYFLLNASSPMAYAQVAAQNEPDLDSAPNNGTPPSVNEDDEASTGGGGPPMLTPDLTISDLQITNSPVQAGQILNYNFDAANNGTDAVPGYFTIKSYLSTDNVLSGNDIQDGTIQTGNYSAGFSQNDIPGASVIPANLAAGQYYLIVKIDADNAVTESNDGNNVVMGTFTVNGNNPSNSCAFTTLYDPTTLSPPNITDEFTLAEGTGGYTVTQINENAPAIPFTEADSYELDAEGNVVSEPVIAIAPIIVKVETDASNNLSMVFEQTPDLPAGTVVPIDINYANPADVLHNSHAVKISNGYAFGIGIVDASGSPVQIINRVITTDIVGQNVEMYDLSDPAFFSGFSRLLEGPDGSLFTSWQTSGNFSLFTIPADGSPVWQVRVATDTPSSEWVDTEVSLDGEFVYTLKTDNQQAFLKKYDVSTGAETALDLVDLKTSAIPTGFRQTRGSGIEPTADGGLLLSLRAFEAFGPAPNVMALAKYDAAGSLAWKQEIPDPNFNVEPLGETADGGALFFGQAFVNSTFPADQVIFIKTAENGALTPLCGDTPPPPSGDCSAVTITPAPGQITIAGATAPHVLIKVFKPNWQLAFECLDNCSNPVVVSGLSAGNHYIEVKLLDAGWGEICKIEQTVNVSSFGGSGGTSLQSKNSRQRLAFDNIYPNPAKYMVTLEIYSKDKQSSVLDFYNQQGQSVHRMEVELVIGRNEVELDISQWRSGTYNIIGKGNGHPAYGRFLKIWEE